MIETAVIIVNWNGKKFLKDCFDSLQNQSYKNFKIILADNGSRDDSVDFVERHYSETEIMRLEKNTGFCFGNNVGIKKALADPNIKYIITLNNDTLADSKYLEELVECAENHESVGSVQPKILNFYNQDEIDCLGITLAPDGTAHNRGYQEVDSGQYEKEVEIFGANGTAGLFTRAALEKTALPGDNFFDNDHFAFYEDVDLAWRMRLAGFSAYFCPKARIFHVHSGTAGKASLFKAYYLHRNYFFTVFKNYPAGIMIKVLAKRFLSYVRLVFNVFRKKKKETEFVEGYNKFQVAGVILKAWGSVIINFPEIIKKRKIIQKNRRAGSGEIKLWLKQHGENS